MCLPNNTRSRSLRQQPDTSRICRNHGFTLLEVLIALSILAIIFTVLTVSFRTALRTITALEERSDVFHSSRLAYSLLLDELQSSADPASGQSSDFIGLHEQQRTRSFDRLVFDSYNFRRYSGGLPGTDLAQFTLWVAHDQLWQQEVPHLTGQTLPGFSTIQATKQTDLEFDFSSGIYPLANHVQEFRLRYHDGTQWLDQWSTQSTRNLPHAISLAMTLQLPGGGEQLFSTFVSLSRGHQTRIQ